MRVLKRITNQSDLNCTVSKRLTLIVQSYPDAYLMFRHPPPASAFRMVAEPDVGDRGSNTQHVIAALSHGTAIRPVESLH